MSLNKDFIKKMQAKLAKEKERIEKDLASFTTAKDGKVRKTIFPQYGDHMGENASEVASFDNAVSVKNTLEKALRDINSSLKRIKDGKYGTCKYCSKEIRQKRLEIRPTSSACIDCKKRLSGES